MYVYITTSEFSFLMDSVRQKILSHLLLKRWKFKVKSLTEWKGPSNIVFIVVSHTIIGA